VRLGHPLAPAGLAEEERVGAGERRGIRSAAARALYDKVADRSGFIQYRKMI
jgi:hypothetical protein